MSLAKHTNQREHDKFEEIGDKTTVRVVEVDPEGVSAPKKQWYVNDIDSVSRTDVTYIGKETKDGEWYILRIDKRGSYPLFRYATSTNNPSLTSYSLAWEERDNGGTVYGVSSSAF